MPIHVQEHVVGFDVSVGETKAYMTPRAHSQGPSPTSGGRVSPAGTGQARRQEPTPLTLHIRTRHGPPVGAAKGQEEQKQVRDRERRMEGSGGHTTAGSQTTRNPKLYL